VLNNVLRRVLQPLTLKRNPSGESGNLNVLCADNNFRLCNLVFAAWLGECPEYNVLHHLEWHVGLWWECAKKQLGDYVPPDKQHPQGDHDLHRTVIDANTKAADAKLSSHHLH
jgi:hypothetical protein